MAAFRWEGRRVVVTGASSGIGEATARELARRGGQPLLVARRKAELERVATDIERETGRTVPVIPGDLANQTQRAQIVEHIAELGTIDVLINNAGITAHGRFDETKPEVLRRTMEVNFFSMAELTAGLLPIMCASKFPERVIALVSTPSGLFGIPGRFAYSASKSAGHALMETLRIEMKSQGFRTTIFCPGYTRTALRTSGLAADGGTLNDEQAAGARSPEEVAIRLIEAVEKRKRFATVGFNGHAVYWGRTVAPGLLEYMAGRKLRRDFESHGVSPRAKPDGDNP